MLKQTEYSTSEHKAVQFICQPLSSYDLQNN